MIRVTKYYAFSIVLCIFLGLQSCDKTQLVDNLKSEQPVYFDIKDKIAVLGDNSRPIDVFSYGIFILPANSGTINNNVLETNREYHHEGSSSVSTLVGNQIFYPQQQAIDIIGYAPYRSGISSTYSIDIRNQIDIKAIDFLYSNSNKNINKQSTAISLAFEHQLSMVNFHLQKSTSSSIDLNKLIISLEGFYDQAAFDLATGVIVNKQLATNPIVIGAAREGIVIPHENINNRFFKFKQGTSEWIYKLPSIDIFEKGKQYDYLITIKDNNLTVELSSVAPWVLNSNIPVEGVISSQPVEYAYIPAGKFLMGAPDTSATSVTDKPQHWVKFSKSFYMSKYETTVAQYAEFLNAIGVTSDGDEGYVFHNFNGKSTYLFYSRDESTPYFENNKWEVKRGRENYPMAGTTWHGAFAYAQWKGGTLPTEAQWEYAYRAGTQTKFFTGNFASDLMSYGYFYNNTGGFIQPVGQKLPNPWGLYDIAGNLLEWCLDGPRNNSISSYVPASDEFNPHIDPVGIISDTGNAYYRGGNYSSPVQTASAYYRNSVSRSYSAWQIGFRIVINP